MGKSNLGNIGHRCVKMLPGSEIGVIVMYSLLPGSEIGMLVMFSLLPGSEIGVLVMYSLCMEGQL